jgi:putative CocE/NonD family hydrolase
MLRILCTLLLSAVAGAGVSAQQLDLSKDAVRDEAALAQAMPDLAKRAIAIYQEPDRDRYLSTLFRLQLVAAQYQKAITSLERLTELRRAADPSTSGRLLPFVLEAKARLRQQTEGLQFDAAFKREFRSQLNELDDLQASDALPWFSLDQNRARNDLKATFEKSKVQDRIALADALDLIRAFQLSKSIEAWLPLTEALTNEDDLRRYFIDKDVLVNPPDGTHISALIVRPKAAKTPQPALLMFTIYAGDDANFAAARRSAAHGYIGVVGFTRGKARSPETPVPFEHDGDDARAVIDWIVKQSWSDGRVGMYGGSYNGFTQWAAAKKLHPALKTIVPSRASNAGNGLPMENNIFLLVNYAWTFYITNNKYLDNKIYFDQARWGSLNQKWYDSGASYRRVDSIDGTPNKWFQTWLQHPSYDQYWQQMVPYKKEFAVIDIPVLTITGYYDDAQQSALWYLQEHYKYNQRAEHYLVIGPYDHFGTDRSRKEPVLRGYAIDPLAQFDTQQLIFQWMDYIFRGAPKPALLADKINYQVMGANKWKHAPSIEKMSDASLTLYLTDLSAGGKEPGDKYQLSANKPAKPGFLEQTVDFADRKTTNNDYYPDLVVGKKPDLSNGCAFISEPFQEPVEISGMFSGQINAIINKKDMDIGVTLFEVMPNGELFHLSYFLGRASYAHDMSVRKLLTPGRVESIPFERTRMTSRRLSKGSRLLVTLNINKNPFAQINYGTGKDVSDEDINDAKTPLQIKWRNDSYVRVPIWK